MGNCLLLYVGEVSGRSLSDWRAASIAIKFFWLDDAVEHSLTEELLFGGDSIVLK